MPETNRKAVLEFRVNGIYCQKKELLLPNTTEDWGEKKVFDAFNVARDAFGSNRLVVEDDGVSVKRIQFTYRNGDEIPDNAVATIQDATRSLVESVQWMPTETNPTKVWQYYVGAVYNSDGPDASPDKTKEYFIRTQTQGAPLALKTQFKTFFSTWPVPSLVVTKDNEGDVGTTYYFNRYRLVWRLVCVYSNCQKY